MEFLSTYADFTNHSSRPPSFNPEVVDSVHYPNLDAQKFLTSVYNLLLQFNQPSNIPEIARQVTILQKDLVNSQLDVKDGQQVSEILSKWQSISAPKVEEKAVFQFTFKKVALIGFSLFCLKAAGREAFGIGLGLGAVMTCIIAVKTIFSNMNQEKIQQKNEEEYKRKIKEFEQELGGFYNSVYNKYFPTYD